MTPETITQALRHLSEADPVMARVIAQAGPPTRLLERCEERQTGNTPPFTTLSKSVVYQQLSIKAAGTIFSRLTALCGGEDRYTPETLLAQSVEDLRGAGLSGRKVEYLQGIATALLERRLDPSRWPRMHDGELVEELVALRGLGEWSVHMYLIFAMGRADVLPTGDLAVRKGFKRLYGCAGSGKGPKNERELPGRETMEAMAQCWRPFRSVGAWYMWNLPESF